VGRPTRTRSLLALAGFLALCLGVAAIGGRITATSVGIWYQGLATPAFNPPDWVFAPVWSALYVLMALAGWLVWRQAGFEKAWAAFAAFALQLALNLAWSFLFFGLHRVGAALVDAVLLLAAILLTTCRFWPFSRPAALLLVPYALWVAFAIALNAAIRILN
jgi:translocator protein